MAKDIGDLFNGDHPDSGQSERPTLETPERVWLCPRCRKPLRRIQGKMGPFWGCTGWPGCEARLHDRDGRPSELPDERYRCPVCTRPMVRTEGRRRRGEAEEATAGIQHYWYCTGYNKGCKVTLDDVAGRPADAWRCPRCGHLLRQRRGKHGVFWGCSQYPLCQASYPDLNDQPKLPTSLA